MLVSLLVFSLIRTLSQVFSCVISGCLRMCASKRVFVSLGKRGATR